MPSKRSIEALASPNSNSKRLKSSSSISSDEPAREYGFMNPQIDSFDSLGDEDLFGESPRRRYNVQNPSEQEEEDSLLDDDFSDVGIHSRGTFDDPVLRSRASEAASRATKISIVTTLAEQGKRALSNTHRRMQRSLEYHNLNSMDLSERIQRDEAGIRFLSVKLPEETRTEHELGDSPPISECFACNRGLNSRVSVQKIEELRDFIATILWGTDIRVVCTKVSEWFLENIMEKHNKAIIDCNLEEPLLSLWSPRSVYDHLLVHSSDATARRFQQQRRLQLIQDWSFAKMFKVPIEAVGSGRVIDNHDLELDQSKYKVFMETGREIEKLERTKPEDIYYTTDKNMYSQRPGLISTSGASENTSQRNRANRRQQRRAANDANANANIDQSIL